MMQRTLDQNALLHARLKEWAEGYYLSYNGGKKATKSAVSKAALELKAYIKAYCEITYPDMFPDLFVKGTHNLSKSACSALFNIMESHFSERFPLAYKPLKRDDKWNSEN